MPSTGWSLGIVYADSEVNGAVVELSRIPVGHRPHRAGGAARRSRCSSRGSITRPLNALDAATQTLAHGDLDAPLPQAKGRDEIAHLTASFGQMRDDLKERIEELRVTTAERERIESELRIAAVHPDEPRAAHVPAVPRSGTTSSCTRCLEPAREVGGDFYDFFLLDDDHLAWPSPTSPARACRRR